MSFRNLEPVTIHPYVDQLSQDMTDERPKTAIRRRDSTKNLFDENDNVAELLPDWNIRFFLFNF